MSILSKRLIHLNVYIKASNITLAIIQLRAEYMDTFMNNVWI